MARTVKCPAGQWTAVFNHAFVQMPNAWTVSFTAADGGSFTGEVAEKRSSWIFRKPPTTLALADVMDFRRGWWNTFYSVRVKPTRDVIAQIR
ncbi:MAG: hypothetical protein Q7K29_03630 [Thermoleophilia bacterium]|nr:hypothetical protein [Thermoleophilia bacterium]